MASCPDYKADPSFQITQGGSTGPYDCTAHSLANVIDAATCGKKDPSGRSIRLLSNEPVPNRSSPGLNLVQIADVAREDFGIYLDVRIGSRALTFDQYERRRAGGEPGILQVGYGPIADSKYDAFASRFRGNHAIAETHLATYDPGADGRYPGIWKYDGKLYSRDVIKHAASQLVIGTSRTGSAIRAGSQVWCAFAPDVVPDFKVRIKAGNYLAYWIRDGSIYTRRTRRTGGFSAICTPPRSYWWPSRNRTATLVKVLSGSKAGQYVSANYAWEI